MSADTKANTPERIRIAAVRQSIEFACKLYRYRHPSDEAGARQFQQIMEQTLLRHPSPVPSPEETKR